MATVTRRIGLSLGADICWPTCFERILERWNPQIAIDGDTVGFVTKRVTIEPFSLRQGCPYDVLLDRLTHWYHTSREWIKKSVIMDGLYVLNNPWSLQSMEKQTTYCLMMHLGLPVPETWMVPPKEYEPSADLESTLQQYAEMFDLGELAEKVGFPAFVKPYDGGGWVGVNRVDNADQFRDAYEKSGKRVLHVQQGVDGFDLFVRALGVGPQVRVIPYDAAAPLHDRYLLTPIDELTTKAEQLTMRRMTLTINAAFGWDFNSCEALRKDGVFHPIDFANACPDSQVTSLHYHFGWLVKALLRWSLFCAATQRAFRHDLDWKSFYRAEKGGGDLDVRLERYAAIADRHFETEQFEDFCERHMGPLDEIAYEFLGTDEAKQIFRQKVEALYPEHEVEEYTELFFSRVQLWREREGQQPMTVTPTPPTP